MTATSAAGLHARALIWDNHLCLPFEAQERWAGQLERCIAAGVSAVTINIGDAQTTLEQQLRMAAHVRALVDSEPTRYLMVRTARDLRDAKAMGRLAIALDVEGAFAIGEQLSIIQLYYDIGVRWMLLVYNRRNLAGSGCHDEHDQGLTPFGRRLVEEMDRVGMLKCCSHTGYRTAREIFASTDRPTIFSHSNAWALQQHPRNVPDDLLRACGASGGVVCLNGVGPFLGPQGATVRRLADHIDHVVQLIGPDHVGLGLDYVFDQQDLDRLLLANPEIWPPELGYAPGIQFIAPEQLPYLTEELLRRGYSDEHVRAVLGENLLRVAEAVWK